MNRRVFSERQGALVRSRVRFERFGITNLGARFGGHLRLAVVLVAIALQPRAAEAAGQASPTPSDRTIRYLISWHGSSWEILNQESRTGIRTMRRFVETSGSAINEYDNELALKATRYIAPMVRDTTEWTEKSYETDYTSHSLDIISDEGRYAGYVADRQSAVALMRTAPDTYVQHLNKGHGPFQGLTYMNLVRKFHWKNHSHSGDTEGSWTRSETSHAADARNAAVDFQPDPSDPTAFYMAVHVTDRISNVRTIEADWTAHAFRLGRCYGRASLKEGDPLIYNERVDLVATPSEIDPEAFATVKLRVTCDQVPIENAEVEVELEPQDNSGGHTHTAKRPHGALDRTDMTNQAACRKSGPPCLKVRTGKDGTKKLTFTPGVSVEGYKLRIAGIYEVTARPTRFPHNARTTTIVAAVKDLFPLPAEADMRLDGQTTTHPVNHYGSPGTLRGFESLAADFKKAQDKLHKCQKTLWTPAKMKVNDIALVTGGLFDAGNSKYPDNKWWRTPHQTHGRGKGGDFDHYDEYSHDKKNANVTVTDCDGNTGKLGDWLGLVLLGLGQPTYGCWDQKDLKAKDDNGNPNPMWHLHVEDADQTCKALP